MLVVLVVLICTALYHALKEWEKNGAVPPQKPDIIDAGRRKREDWEYFFNRLNDEGWFYLQGIVMAAPSRC